MKRLPASSVALTLRRATALVAAEACSTALADSRSFRTPFLPARSSFFAPLIVAFFAPTPLPESFSRPTTFTRQSAGQRSRSFTIRAARCSGFPRYFGANGFIVTVAASEPLQ